MNFKRLILFFVGAMAVLLIQFVLNYFLRGSFLYLYLPLVYLFIISIHSNGYKGIWCGAFLGLLTDVYEPTFVGINVLTFAIFGLISGIFNNRKWIFNRLVKSILFLLFTQITFYFSTLIEVSMRQHGFLYMDALKIYSNIYLPSIFISFFAIHAVMCFTEKER